MIEIKSFSFQYDESKHPTLSNIDLTIQDGEFVLLTGRSGCGKTTLIRSLNGLIPHFYPGKIGGDLLMNGSSVLKKKPAEIAGTAGTVFQDPRSQFFMTDTTRELAFGCENMGLSREETIQRIVEAADDLELAPFLNRSIFALSSGEKQQIAIGSVYALNPKVFIFDEPSANLDHNANRRLAEILGSLKKRGYTIVVAEHRFYYFRDLIDRACWIEDGQLKQTFTGEQFCNLEESIRIQYGLRTAYPENETKFSRKPNNIEQTVRTSLAVDSLDFCFKDKESILHNIRFHAESGDIVGIIGNNGAGKTTLLSIISGILKETAGTIVYDGKRLKAKQRLSKSYLVMQDADYQLFGSSVEEELALGVSESQKEKIDNVLKSLGLIEYKERHPASLSGGQKQRVTIGAAIVKGSPIICFDEPTSGLDYDSMVRVSLLIQSLADSGIIVFVVSHDFEFIIRSCTKVLQLDSADEIKSVPLADEVVNKLTIEFFDKGGEILQKGNENEMKKESPLKRLWELAENHTREITFSIVLATAGVVFGILPYISGGELVGGILSKNIDQNFYLFWCGIALLGYAGKSVLYALALSVSHKATFSALAEIRKKMLDKLPKLSLGTLSETPSGAFKQKILDQVEAMERPLAHMFPEMTANLLGPLFILAYLLFVDWRMALLSLVSFPLGMIFMGSIFKSYGEQYAGAMKVGGAMNATLVEYVDGLEVIRNYNQTESSYKKLSEKIFTNAQYYYDWMTKTQFSMSMSKAITPTTLLAVLPVGYIFYSNGSLSFENYLLSIILSFSLQGLLTSAMQFATVQTQVGTMVDTVDSILKAPEQIHKEKALGVLSNNIKLEDVSFSYEEGVEILSNVSLEIEEGSTNAFVGLSGGGKSTIARLIAGFWDVEKGKISLGGVDYKDIPLEQLYNQISFISQDNFLFDENIRDNIRMGKPDATDREVEDVAKKSGCHNFIMNLENGYETRVGKSGSSLSGGERQRVTIARAMLKDSPIIIFDEATAYMDPENEYLVQEALNKLMENKTVIVIAHRLSTIKDSDNIFVIDRGRVESRGKHEDLLEDSRIYRNLWFAHVGKEEE